MSTACMSAVFRHSVSKGSQRLVLLAMADEANDEGLLTAYRRSQSHLARKANVDEGTVGRAIKALVTLGEVDLLARGDGRRSSDYRLVLPGIEGVQDATPGSAIRAPRGGDVPPQGPQDATPIIPFSPSPTPSAPPTRDGDVAAIESAFASFWHVYPRHTDKGSARRAWTAAVKKATPSVIIEGATRYANDPNRDEAYTKHASTWLNAEAWDNPPLPPRAKPNGKAPTHRPIMDDRSVASGRIEL